MPPRWRSWQQSALRSCHRASMIGLACFDAVGGDVAVAVVVDHRIERMGVDERGAVAKFGGERPGNCFCSYVGWRLEMSICSAKASVVHEEGRRSEGGLLF